MEGAPGSTDQNQPGWLQALVSLAQGSRRSGQVATLIVQVSGEPDAIAHSLASGTTSIGRGEENDISLPVPFVSRQQATLKPTATGCTVELLPGATTPITYRGTEMRGAFELEQVDYFRLAGESPGQLVTCIYVGSSANEARPVDGFVAISAGRTVRIGSAPDSDIGSESPLLAPHQLEIARDDGQLTIRDLGTGTTLLDGEVLVGEAVLGPGAFVAAGGLRITAAEDGVYYRDPSAALLARNRRARVVPDDILSQAGGTGGVELVAVHLNREVRGGNLLHDISLRVRPREMVVLVGLSGAGKSTLMNALTGFRPATSGDVMVDRLSLYQNLDQFRSAIGYVPQRDIVHAQLTVFEALDYAARLRLPPGTSREDRHRRIEAILGDLGLGPRRDQLVARLSGGQVKRVSIGVELISQPQIIFLDEPTSGLDPVTETGLMQLLRGLADQGRTVVVITHATKNVMLADKVIFLVPGGRVAWFGPPSEALSYFNLFRPERERDDRTMEFDQIYRILEDPNMGTAEEWEARYRGGSAHERYISRPLGLDAVNLAGGTMPSLPGRPPSLAVPPSPSALRQFIALSGRNLRLLTRDRFALVLMIAAAPLLAMLDFLITQRHMFDSVAGDAARIVTNTNTIIVNAMLVGALAQMREIIKDRDIYRRERLVNLRIAPYVLSKVWIAGLLALYQAAAWTAIRYLAVDMPGGLSGFGDFYLTLVLVTFAGMMLGLFASAVSPSEDAVALIVALLIVPQVLFSGAHLPVHKLNSIVRAEMNVMPSRWAFEALITSGGHGKAVADDACWAKTTAAERASLTAEQKGACACLGPNLFDRCPFPGIQAFRRNAGQGAGAEQRAVALAEGRLEVDHDAYGPIYNVGLASRWLALGLISAGLIAIIVALQRFKDRL